MYDSPSAADFGGGPQPEAPASGPQMPSRRRMIVLSIPILFFATFPAVGFAWVVTKMFPSFTMWTGTFLCSSPYHLTYDTSNPDGATYQCVSGASSQPVDSWPIMAVHAVLFAVPIYALLGLLVFYWW